MSSRDRNVDIKEFLANINLVQYLPYFKEAGYNAVSDCIEINNNVLQQIGISPTGHRKRILKQLEITFSKMQEKSVSSENLKHKDLEELGESHSLCYAQVSKISNLSSNGVAKASPEFVALPARLFSKEKSEFTEHELLEVKDGSFSDLESSSSSYQKSDCSGDAVSLSGNIEKSTNFQNIPNMDVALEKSKEQQGNLHFDSHSALYVEDPSSQSSFANSSEAKSSENEHLTFSQVEISPNVVPDSPFFEFKGEMVDNDLYGPCKQSCMKVVPRTTRSFMLRHRPVPEIPGSSKIAASPSSLQERRNVDVLNISGSSTSCTGSPTSQKKTSSEEMPSVIFPYGETFLFNSLADAKEICRNEFLAFEEKFEDKEVTGEHCLHDKSCVFNIQKGKASSEDHVKNELISQEDTFMLPEQLASESEYTTVEECSPYLRTKNHKAQKYSSFPTKNRSRNLEHSVKESIYFLPFDDKQTITPNDSITPYACFYGSSVKKVKAGWLDKLSPQGKRMFQKRWVKFDGDTISYYNNDKEVYSKGIILLSAIVTVRVHGENKFEVVTAHRTFVFRVEKEDERIDWINTMLSALKSPQTRAAVTPEKSGYLELKGYKAKIFTLLLGNNVWLCKSEQDFKTGFGITIIPMNVANVKQVDRTAKQSFEIITPYKSFSFTAESEGEKQEWIEALQQSIAETLSDYEVAEKIWFNESNRSCADCKAPDPDWASINLCVVICKKCAGQHRSLGPRDSKVRSLKMDASIWSNELIELFIVIGNKRANSFWAGKLQPEEELHMDSPLEKRITFITQKYKEGRFRKTPMGYKTKEELNKALCAAVVKQDVLETMTLLFSGADVMCATGDPVYSTPYLLAKKAGQRLQMEFLYHNKFSDFPNYDTDFESGFSQDASHSTFLCEFLYKVSYNAAKLFSDRKLKEDCNKRWCTLESGFLSYYENDKTTTPNGMIDISEVICLVVHKEDSFLNTGAIFTFEIYLLSERVFLFGAETAHSQRKWTWAIAKHFVPFVAECLLKRDYDLIGQLYYKDCHNLDQWRKGWFAIDKSSLHFCLEMENAQEDSIHLRRLQELTISSVIQNGEKIDVLLLVEKGRTLYIHGHTKLDFTVWHTAIEKAASTDGNALQDQQLSKNDVPIIVNSCIAFVTQYGLGSKHIYSKNGDPSHVSELLESFKKDARSVKLRAGTHQLEDVTDVLKCFLSQIDDALLTKELYPFWISALDTQNEKERVRKYGTFIQSLPPVNRATLAALIEHLYRVHKCSEINYMNPHNLAMAFSSCLFQTKGHTSEEVNVIEDLIKNYVQLFDINEDQVKQMDTENRFITKWKDTQVSQAGDLLIEVYVERKEPDCSIIIRVSPLTEAEELTNDVLGIKNIIPNKDEIWAAFEVIENGELERPLHYTENVLEQVLHWSSLPEPGSAHLVIKKFLTADAVKLYNEKNAKGNVKAGYLKYKEEPSKLLSGNKFQERYFVLREGNLLLYKDMKSSKPEKVLPLSSLKLYLGVKKKMKPPTNWGLTVYSEKHHWHMCCDGQDTQMEWMTSIFNAQHSDIWPPAGKARKQSITKNPKIGGLPLIPIQQEKNTSKTRGNAEHIKAGKLTFSEQDENDIAEEKKNLKERAYIVAQCLGRKEEKVKNHVKKHRSLICVEDTGADIADLHQSPYKESRTLKKHENKTNKSNLESDKLPPNVIQELNTVLQKNRALHEET
ncbi:arf-GAP with Rho-GAP domain, ANK repeat and PH domain-containing protein 2 isoform X1 [Mauremys reevesii]|uniref:arf-GAP with Rho-GAP domain, ANK repeat and PH domain-containing protein 2 isoform X1 n=1 Tax=Mauremys reevesii TaxID=260615 RepID=UPI00193EDE82|nr:arf-GAP with Rho-GAP domain, ANK repeat and PH domain-containing protein 2 isoform X1 [Mauremys reevesii]XP_039397821.1 arf-GAP with Rho-GAP domain, ANK repeat and PH domain-containing protein 2 isoform X1 [Mauremys reevesii]